MLRRSLLAWVPLCALALPAPAADPQAAVVILIDGSGSMNEPPSPAGTPFEQAIAASSLFVAGCDETIAPGIITFDSAVQILTPRLEAATPARRRELLAVLRKARAGGQTDILGAAVAALKLLEDSKAPAKWVVLLSDGEQTQGIPAGLLRDTPAGAPAADLVRTAGKALAAQAKARGIRVLTVGLGQDADRGLLESLAAETGGAYVAVQNPVQLLPAYADWLRTVGGYQVTRGEQVQVADGDADLKVLLALPRSRVPALERDGRAVEPEKAGFETWADGRRLHVWQAGRPDSGTYRLRFNPDRGKDDHLVFLKRSGQHWDVRLDYLPGNPAEPLRVEVRGTPAPAAGKALDATLLITDAQGKETERTLPLRPRADGTLTGEFTFDGVSASEAATRNVRVRLRDPSGWETQHVQTVRFEPAAPVNLRVHVYEPRDVVLARGQKRALAWELRLDGEGGVSGEVAADLTWTPSSPSAPRLRLDGGGDGTTLRIPLAATTRIPLTVEVPTGTVPGSYEARLTLRVVGERPVTLNGVPTLSLPATFRVEPSLVRIQLLDAAGQPLPGNVCTHRVLSPVAGRTEELHFLLVGDADADDWQVRLTQPEADGVRCGFERRRDGADRLVVRLIIPAQTAPGGRSFPFDIEPGPGIRLTEDSRQFRVDLDIPPASIRLAAPSGGPIEVRRPIGYLEWVKLRALGRSLAWQERVVLDGKASGLDDRVAWHIAALAPGASELEEETDAEGGRSWKATLAGEVTNSGAYSIRAAVACPYRHVRLVDAAGNPLPLEGGQAVVGKVEIVPPSPLPPLVLLLVVAGLFAVDRWRRGRVPGQLLLAAAADTVFGGQRRPVRLGGKHQRVVVGGQTLEIRRRWGAVQVRWARGQADETTVALVCPSGHERYLRLGGAWEPLCNHDVVRAGNDEAKYLAPVARHCTARPVTVNDPLFS
jgi:KaiC/GvpD/RAD55 family RecA-like ATPase